MKFLALLVMAFALNAEATIYNSKAIVHPEVGKNGMVVSQHYLATNVGHSILAEGGNAYDASIAVAFALAVVLPRAGNIGGGGFMVMFDEAAQESYSIDYRETAPETATKNMFLASDGSVEAYLQGEESSVNDLLALCWEGPTIADVEDVLTQDSSVDETINTFEIH